MSREPKVGMRENALRIMEALSGVDEELLERCGKSPRQKGAAEGFSLRTKGGLRKGRSGFRKHGMGQGERRGFRTGKRPIWQIAGTWAAVLCLGVVGIAGWWGYGQMKETADGSSGGTLLQGSSTVYDEHEMNGAGQDAGQEGCSPEAAPENGGAADMEEQKTGMAQGNDAAQEGGASRIDDESARLGDDGVQNGDVTHGNGATHGNGVTHGNSAANGDGTTHGNSVTHGNSTTHGNGAGQVGSAEDAMKEKDQEAGGRTDADSNSQVMDGMVAEGCIKQNTVEYTEQEARRMERLGEYVPRTLPEGYGFERAYSDPDLGRENLTVSWSRGMDLILLHLEVAEGTVETVDIQKPETYDQRLYEIPYGETVPEEYRQAFWNPVFALDDFSLEIAESRMMIYEDSGDTDTPRGNFKVLYPDGVLASFNGRGTAQEIWEMFSSMKP